MTLKNLSYIQQKVLLSNFFTQIGQLEPYSNKLVDLGLKSFLAWPEFEQECCSTVQELAELPRYSLERSRFSFSAPDRIIGKELSEQLNALRPWGDRFEGGEIQYQKLSELQSIRIDRLRKYRLEEYNLWRNESAFDPHDHATYVDYYSEVMLDAFNEHGFCYDLHRSVVGFPVFSKPLVAGWDICWSSESSRTLEWWPRVASDDVHKWSQLELLLYVSSSKKKSGRIAIPIGSGQAPFMFLRLGILTPGFEWAYTRFNGVEQLAFCIYAYSHLYSMFASKIETELAMLLKSHI
jgi:hypothetical protein